MPTPVKIDSFQHRVLEASSPAGATRWGNVIDASTPPVHDGTDMTYNAAAARTADHAVALKMVQNATSGVGIVYTFAAAPIVVGSVYFKSDTTTNPSGNTTIIYLNGPTAAQIRFDSSGQIAYLIAGGATQTIATDFCDAEWHRLDYKYDTTTTSGTLDVQVDGSAGTQATGTVTAGNQTTARLGSNGATTAYTMYFSDYVLSTTGADYPIGDHICKMLTLTGTGTHSQSTGAFTDEAGGTSDAALLAAVDDAWDGTTPNLTQTGEDYVQQTANAAAGYVEFTFSDPAAGDTTIWAAQLGVLMASEDATTADNCEARLIHSGTTYATTGLIDPSESASMYAAYRVINSSTPGGDGWSNTELAAATVRFGFSTDAAPDALFNSAIVEYVTPWSASQTVTGTVLTVTPTLPVGALTHTITGTVLTVTPSLPTGAVTTPGAGQQVDGVVLTITPTLPIGALAHTLTGTVLTVTPSLPTGSLGHSLTGTVLTVIPTLPTGALTHTVTGTVLTVTPSLPIGSVSAGAQVITGVVLTVTPSLPIGELKHQLTGTVLTIVPTLPIGALQHSLTGTVLTVTPSLPVGALKHSITGVVLTIIPTLPVGSVVGPVTVTGTVLAITPVLPGGQVLKTHGVFLDEQHQRFDQPVGTTVVNRPSLRAGARFRRSP